MGLSVVACGGGSGSASGSGSAAASTRPITVLIAGDFQSWDPQKNKSNVSSQIATGLFDNLVALGANLKVVPYLASSWTTTPTSVTFHLRTNATCSDGSKMTPSVVAASFNRMFSVYPAGANKLFGPGPFSVSANDSAGTFTFTSKTPYNNMIDGFAQTDAQVLCKADLANGPSLDSPIGSGPYTLASAKSGDSVVLKIRPDWKWGPGGATSATLPSQITFKEVTNSTTAANLLSTNAADLGLISGPDINRLKADPSLRNLVGLPTSVNPIGFNTQPGHVTADPQVRLALMTAVNADDFSVAAFGKGNGVSSTSLYTKTMPCFDPATANLIPKTSLAKAGQILAADGYTKGSGGKLTKNGQPLSVHLIGSTQIFGEGMAYLQSQWNQLGITANWQDEDTAALNVDYIKGNFDAAVIQLNGEQPTPDYYSAYVAGPLPPGLNLTWALDPKVTAARDAAQRAGSSAESCRHWATFQEALISDQDILPLAGPKYEWFSHGVEFANYVPNTIDVRWLRAVAQ
jgi:peptide/nickel transport system substrate-binding protein